MLFTINLKGGNCPITDVTHVFVVDQRCNLNKLDVQLMTDDLSSQRRSVRSVDLCLWFLKNGV